MRVESGRGDGGERTGAVQWGCEISRAGPWSGTRGPRETCDTTQGTSRRCREDRLEARGRRRPCRPNTSMEGRAIELRSDDGLGDVVRPKRVGVETSVSSAAGGTHR